MTIEFDKILGKARQKDVAPIPAEIDPIFTASEAYKFVAGDKAKLDGLSNYTLPTASGSVLGGIKVGSGLSIDINGILSATPPDLSVYVLKSGSLTQLTTRSHADLQNLLNDDHTQYALLAGRSGGQSLALGVRINPFFPLDVLGSNNFPVKIVGNAGGGFILGAYDANWGGFWPASVTPGLTNYGFIMHKDYGVAFNISSNTSTSNGIQFNIADSTKMWMDHTGKFGINIGQANASAQLEVDSPTATTIVAIFKTTDDSSTKSVMEIQGSGGSWKAKFTNTGALGIGGLTPSGDTMTRLHKTTANTTNATIVYYSSYLTHTTTDSSDKNVFTSQIYSQGTANQNGTVSALFGDFHMNQASPYTTANGVGIMSQIFHVNTGTLTKGYGWLAKAPSFSSTGTIGTLYGGYIENQGNALITDSCGLYIAAQSGSTNSNYAIYSNAGLVHFGDSVDLASGKNLTLLAGNIITDTSTGTKIGTAANQKISLWNATPNVQPTTAITAAAFLANASGIVDDSATFGGYTIGQIAAALKQIGALA